MRSGLGWTVPIVDADVRRRASELADRLEAPSGFGPDGWPDSDADRRDAWCLRSGLTVPAWCATDPRIDAAAALVCAALDALADDGDMVLAREPVLATMLRLLPSEHDARLSTPLRRLDVLGIAAPVRGGGWLLTREHVETVGDVDEASLDALIEWARALPAGDGATVRGTLAEVIEAMAGGVS